MKQQLISLFILLLISVNGFSQIQKNEMEKQNLYTDFVADENGNRLSGITVSIRGKNSSTKTNTNGVFKIKAAIGDLIVLSKNDKIINTYIYNGSPQYRIEDNSGIYSKSIKKKFSSNLFDRQIDSAKYYIKSNPFQSITFVEQALKLQTSKRANTNNIGQAYEVLGDVYLNLKQYDLAVDNYKISVKNRDSNIVNFKLAQALSLNQRNNESIKVLNELLALNINAELKVGIYEALGVNYQQLNQIDKAIEHIENALKIAKENNVKSKISNLNSVLGELYLAKGNSAKAQQFFDNSIENTRSESLNKRAAVTNLVANQYKKQQKFDKEIELKKQTLQELEAADVNEIDEPNKEDKISVQQLNLDIGNAYAKKKSYNEAINYLEKSKEKSEKAFDIETQKDAVQQLSEIYKNVGDFNKALNSYQEYVGLVDLLYKKKEKEIADAVTLNKSLIEKQNRINSLEKDRELLESKYQLYESEQQITVENYKRQQLIIYSLIGGLLLLLSAVYFMYKSNKQRRLANNLLALKSLRSQMNPHFIFNALNSVNSFIAQNDERTANRYLTEFSTLMRNVLDNSEADFIPLSNEIEMLELYMKLEHSRFKDKFDYKIEVDEHLKISEYQIPPMLLQPYVENAVWHGLRYKKDKGSLNVSIQQKNENSIQITIADDGIGRNKSKELKTENQQKQQSKGMDNIKKRVHILNEMYNDKVDVFICDLHSDTTGTKVVLTLKKD